MPGVVAQCLGGKVCGCGSPERGMEVWIGGIEVGHAGEHGAGLVDVTGVPRCARDLGEPGCVDRCVLLSLIAGRGDTGLEELAPLGQELLRIGLKLALLGEVQLSPA